MAFIPVAAGAGIAAAAVAGGGIGGTAVGLSVTAKNRAKHTTTSVTHGVVNLTEGDRISLKRKGNLPFQHAIVLERVQIPTDNIKVVYLSGSKASAQVESTEVDLNEQARNGELFRHEFEALICFPAHVVVARAKSLCPDTDFSPDRRDVIHQWWSFFRDDEHFASWCQIGFSVYNDGMKSPFLTKYNGSWVSDIACLTEGKLY